MGYADEMGRLRHEIDEMRGDRIALKERLNHYAADLRRDMNQQRSTMRQHNSEEAARTKAAMTSFVTNMRSTMRETMGGFQRERDAAHRGWMRPGVMIERAPASAIDPSFHEADRSQPHRPRHSGTGTRFSGGGPDFQDKDRQ